MKKTIGCLLATVMLLTVTFISVGAYTTNSTCINTNNEEPVNTGTAELYGNVRERYKVHWGWEHRPFVNVEVIALHPGFIPWNPWLYGQIETIDTTDENGRFSLNVSTGNGRYFILTRKEGYITQFPAGHWYYPLFWQRWIPSKEPIWVDGWFCVHCEPGDYIHYTFTLWKERYKPPMIQPINTFQQILFNLGK